MNHCDHDHETREEIRRLPAGKSPHHGAILVCHRHYLREMAYREHRAKDTGRDKWRFPEWNTLVIDQPEVTVINGTCRTAHNHAAEEKIEASDPLGPAARLP